MLGSSLSVCLIKHKKSSCVPCSASFRDSTTPYQRSVPLQNSSPGPNGFTLGYNEGSKPIQLYIWCVYTPLVKFHSIQYVYSTTHIYLFPFPTKKGPIPFLNPRVPFYFQIQVSHSHFQLIIHSQSQLLTWPGTGELVSTLLLSVLREQSSTHFFVSVPAGHCTPQPHCLCWLTA